MATSLTNFTINWIPSSTTISQQVQYRKTGASWTTYSTVGATVGTASISGLDANSLYEFRIVSSCTLGGSTTSNSTSMVSFSCPQVTLSSGSNSVNYSFAHPNADVNSVSIDLLSSVGSVLGTQNPAYMNPVVGSFAGLTEGTTYGIRPRFTIGSFTSQCSTTQISTSVAPPQPAKNILLTNTKDEDPHVDTVLIPLVNGVNRGNIYASGSATLDNLFVGDVIDIYLNRSIYSNSWPVGSTARLRVTDDGNTIFDSGNLYSPIDEITHFQFTIANTSKTYTVLTTSLGDSTDYLPVIITQINNSSAPLSTTQPPHVLFTIKDNTNNEMVFNDGTYQNPQINGFNFLDTNGALLQQGTLIIKNNWTGNLKFLVQNYDASATYWDIVVAANSSVTLSTLPKASVRITYTDA